MKKVKHPIPEVDLQQEIFLKNISEENRKYHSLLFSFGNAAYLYHELPHTPTILDYNEWLDGISDPVVKQNMREKGFEACKNILAFTRYVREKNDIGFDRFIEETMGEELYNKYKSVHE